MITIQTVSDISLWIILALGFLVPAWLLCFPPTRLRRLPFGYRPLAALLAGVGSIYASYHALLATSQYFWIHEPGLIFDGFLAMFDPAASWIGVGVTTALWTLVALTAQVIRDPEPERQ